MPIAQTIIEAGKAAGRKTRATLSSTAKKLKASTKRIKLKNPLASWFRSKFVSRKELIETVNKVEARLTALEQSRAVGVSPNEVAPVKKSLQEMSSILEGIKSSIGAGKSHSVVQEVCPLCKRPVAHTQTTAVLIETTKGIARVCKNCLNSMMRRGAQEALSESS